MNTAVISHYDQEATFDGDSIIATVIMPCVADGVAINPTSLDVTKVIRRPLITIGQSGPRVGVMSRLFEGEDGQILVKFILDDTEVGKSALRLFKTQLLWWVQATVTVKHTEKTTEQSRETYGFPDDCLEVATEASLDSITLDPFAPY